MFVQKGDNIAPLCDQREASSRSKDMIRSHISSGGRLLCLSLSLTMVACGGGSSGTSVQDTEILPDEELPDDSQVDDIPPVNSGFNGGLSGRILSTVEGIPIQYDVSTGEYTRTPVFTVQQVLLNNELPPIIHGNAYFEMGGENAGGQYMHTVRDCQLREVYTLVDGSESGIEYYDSCIAISNADLSGLGAIRLDEAAVELPPRLSPSGLYVAYNDFFPHVCCDNRSWLVITSIADSTRVAEVEIDMESSSRYVQGSDSPMDWLPDDRLVYTVPSDDRVIVYITNPATLEVDRKITLPEAYQGEVESLDVSPDGTRLLMGYDSDQNLFSKGILLLNLETLDITVPAIDPADEGKATLQDDINGYIYSPHWSPDGQWIMVLNGLKSRIVGDSTVLATDPSLYAVPADKTLTVLTQEKATDAVLIRMTRPSNPDAGPIDTWHLGQFFDWVD